MPKTERDYQRLRAARIRTILDLRTPEEGVEAERIAATSHGFLYRSFPFSALNDSEPTERTMSGILQDLTDASLFPIYLHCYMGRDRTGLTVALYRVKVEGMPPEQAYAEWRSFGFEPGRFLGLLHYFTTHTR